MAGHPHPPVGGFFGRPGEGRGKRRANIGGRQQQPLWRAQCQRGFDGTEIGNRGGAPFDRQGRVLQREAALAEVLEQIETEIDGGIKALWRTSRELQAGRVDVDDGIEPLPRRRVGHETFEDDRAICDGRGERVAVDARRVEIDGDANRRHRHTDRFGGGVVRRCAGKSCGGIGDIGATAFKTNEIFKQQTGTLLEIDRRTRCKFEACRYRTAASTRRTELVGEFGARRKAGHTHDASVEIRPPFERRCDGRRNGAGHQLQAIGELPFGEQRQGIEGLGRLCPAGHGEIEIAERQRPFVELGEILQSIVDRSLPLRPRGRA
jgi:hypothetical protein